VETIKDPMLEYAVATSALPGNGESGDRHVVMCNQHGVVVAVIDGIGHGEQAASAADAAAAILKDHVDEPIISLVERCHEKLRSTRGVVLSLASVDVAHGLMTWLGVGNVQGVLMRGDSKRETMFETLLLRGGVVGSLLPALQATVLQVTRGDTLYFVTDGVRHDFLQSLTALENPRRAADRILRDFRSGNDDALVLAARLTGIRP
jgi:phosphoserine phosphatase RsbX